jgi:ech hydrogenase subunit D
MKYEEQETLTLDRGELVAKATGLSGEGYRLVQICAVTTEQQFEINYSFDKEYRFLNLRVMLSKDDPVLPSITTPYFAAFTYENELQDLFGIKVTDLALNFNGTFYRISTKQPFAQAKEAVASPGAAK